MLISDLGLILPPIILNTSLGPAFPCRNFCDLYVLSIDLYGPSHSCFPTNTYLIPLFQGLLPVQPQMTVVLDDSILRLGFSGLSRTNASMPRYLHLH